METVHKLGVYTKIDTGTVRKKRVIQGTWKNYCDVYIRLKTKRIIYIYLIINCSSTLVSTRGID